MNNNFAIIVAAGTGSRMASNLPKQFMLLDGKPILMHTITKFSKADVNAKIIIVLSEDMMNYWEELCLEYHFDIPHAVCVGGNSRFQSVKNATSFIQSHYNLLENDVIAVHDAARPLVSTSLIEQLFQACHSKQAALIPAVQSSNSVRLGNQEQSKSIDRNDVWLVQTPQVFEATLFQKAYEQEEDSSFTDDASVIEKMSNSITIIPGDYKNIKITLPEDIAIAQYYLNSSN